MAYKDIREYLTALKQRGLLRVVDEPVNKDTELMPLVRWQYRALAENQRTGFYFTNLVGTKGEKYKGSLAVAIVGASRKVYACGLDCEIEKIAEKWEHALSNPIAPTIVESGPVQDEIHIGDSLLEHGGLDEFPIHLSTPGFDPAPYITAGSWHTKDPETGVQNIGTYRAMIKGQLKTGLSTRHNHITAHWAKYRKLRKPMPAAIVIGGPPSIAMTSVTKVPFGVDEMTIAGALDGKPLEVVKCQTIDMLVPAYAEIVIEGEVLTDYKELEAPFGEYTGYVAERDFKQVFVVKCITHRKDPVYHDFISQMPPSESSMIRSIGEESGMLKFLRVDCGLTNVKDVGFPQTSGGWQMCVIQLHKVWTPRPTHSEAWQALCASLARAGGYPKMAVAVDDDIDPRDVESVVWALSFRQQPHLDMKIIEGRFSALDPSSAPPEASLRERFYPMGATGPRGGSSILIDATMKWPYPPVALPDKRFMDAAKERWEKLGFPELTPKKPWHGYDLGHWTDQNRLEADRAVAGDFMTTIAELEKSGIQEDDI